MNRGLIRCFALSLTLLAGSGALTLGASFQNLGFDDAITNNATFTDLGEFGVFARGPATDLAPGWQIYFESKLQTELELDYTPLNCCSGLLSEERDNRQFGGSHGVEGHYGFIMGSFTGGTWSLIQHGQVPSDANLIRFKTFAMVGSDHPIDVFINGAEIPLRPESNIPFPGRPDFLIGDISAYQGREIELHFIGTFGLVDSISFQIPEPSPTALLFPVGGFFLVLALFRALAPGEGAKDAKQLGGAPRKDCGKKRDDAGA